MLIFTDGPETGRDQRQRSGVVHNVDWLIDIDWKSAFTPDVPLLETALRGTLMYLGIFTLLRLVRRRQRGSLGVTDLLVVVLLAEASQDAMTGDSETIINSMVLIAVIMGWAVVLDVLAQRFPRFERLVHPPPLFLYRNGKVLWRNMKKELVTYDELMEQVRVHGFSDLSEVHEIRVEGEGDMSIIGKEDA